jgi:hypothetical protein
MHSSPEWVSFVQVHECIICRINIHHKNLSANENLSDLMQKEVIGSVTVEWILGIIK